MAPPLTEKLVYWLDPALFMSVAAKHYIVAMWNSLLHNPHDMINGVAHAKGFANFWLEVSPPADGVDKIPLPPPGTAFSNLPALLASASGTVLELGPGSGRLMSWLDPSKISTMVAIEPAVHLHAALRESATAVGLEGSRFEVLSCGADADSLIPALARSGIIDAERPHVFDTVVSVRSLCTLANARDALAAHYALLKPGGRLIIFEHVVNQWPHGEGSSVIGRALQYVFTLLGWPFFVGCSLTQDTVAMIEDAAAVDGGWDQTSLTRAQEWGTLPWAFGTFVKKNV